MNERIALGFGNNIDYEIVWDSEVVQDLIIQYDIYDVDLSIDRIIHNERDLLVSILGFLKAGVGGERFVVSSSILERFSEKFNKKITLGGTSVRAAIAMRKLGYTSALHLVTMNEDVQRLLPPDCPYVCNQTEDSLYPHLIVQFAKDTRVKANDIDICTEQANRIIYHNDLDNITMRLNDDFVEQISDAKVLLISGFNAMQSETLLVDRLRVVSRFIDKLSRDALVYYEEAGFYEPKFSQLIYHTLGKHIDVVGLNEDELQKYLNRKVDLLNAFDVQASLEELQKLISVPTLVVHCNYWALAYGVNASRFSEALRGGVSMATARFCYGDSFTKKHYEKVKRLPPNPEGARFAVAINKVLGKKVCCVPVAQVEQLNATAVGLGDAFVGGFLPLLAV